MSRPHLRELASHEQRVWIDHISRDLLESGRLDRAIREAAVVGVTSNPDRLHRALGPGRAYDAQLEELVGVEDDPKELFIALGARDVRDACDLLRPHVGGDRRPRRLRLESRSTLAARA